MKKLCRNCGAKVPKKSDICPKCGEPYEYIDVVRISPEEESIIKVEKPSLMLNICILILAVLVFAYSLMLVYLRYTDRDDDSDDSQGDIPAVTDEVITENEDSTPDLSMVHYNAIDFPGMTFGDVKKILGEKHVIRITGDGTQIVYDDFNVTLRSLDNPVTDDSLICGVILTGNAQVTPVVTADMTFDQLKIVLALTQSAPELNAQDAYYYVHKTFENDACQMTADFRFDDESADKAPIEVVITDISLSVPKNMGTVAGLDDYLNLREQPSSSAEAITQLVNGDEVEIVESYTSDDGTEWYKVIYDETMTGYVAAEFVVKNTDIKNNDMFSQDESSASDEDSDTEDSGEESESEDEDDE